MREIESLWANISHWPLRTVAAVLCIPCRRFAVHTVKYSLAHMLKTAVVFRMYLLTVPQVDE